MRAAVWRRLAQLSSRVNHWIWRHSELATRRQRGVL